MMKPYGAKRKTRCHIPNNPKKTHGRGCVICYPPQKPRVGSKKAERKKVSWENNL